MAKLSNIDTTGIGGDSGSSAGGLTTTITENHICFALQNQTKFINLIYSTKTKIKAGDDDGLFAMLACVGVLICMISTLVGIKIWWFKHRLTFDHGRTNNGAAGGATHTLPLRTRSSREKRLSQEVMR